VRHEPFHRGCILLLSVRSHFEEHALSVVQAANAHWAIRVSAAIVVLELGQVSDLWLSSVVSVDAVCLTGLRSKHETSLLVFRKAFRRSFLARWINNKCRVHQTVAIERQVRVSDVCSVYANDVHDQSRVELENRDCCVVSLDDY
jgi:hypothetical protein